MPSVERIRQIMDKAREGRTVDIEYEGEAGKGLQGGLTADTEWQIQGYRRSYSFSVWIHANEFEADIRDGNRIKIDGTEYRILGNQPDSIGAEIRLDIGGVHAAT